MRAGEGTLAAPQAGVSGRKAGSMQWLVVPSAGRRRESNRASLLPVRARWVWARGSQAPVVRGP